MLRRSAEHMYGIFYVSRVLYFVDIYSPHIRLVLVFVRSGCQYIAYIGGEN